jgi:ATP-dependent Clp protease ATP-binding subunit ClpA
MNFFDQKMLEIKIAGEAHSGKTSLAKAIGKTLDEEPIYIDLKEYNTHESLTRLIGSEIGYVGSDSKRELIFDIVESNPRKVVILDNYDKMHPTIKNLFETSIKNQSLRYADNRTIDLSKTVFIIITEKTSKSSIGFIDNSEAENDTIKKLSNDEMKEVVQKKLDKKIAELAVTHPRFQNATADITDDDITEKIDVNALIEEKIMSI